MCKRERKSRARKRQTNKRRRRKNGWISGFWVEFLVYIFPRIYLASPTSTHSPRLSLWEAKMCSDEIQGSWVAHSKQRRFCFHSMLNCWDVDCMSLVLCIGSVQFIVVQSDGEIYNISIASPSCIYLQFCFNRANNSSRDEKAENTTFIFLIIYFSKVLNVRRVRSGKARV